MKIEPLANNLVVLTVNNGMIISVSDDGDYISIQRKISVYHAATRIKGELIDYARHFSNESDPQFESDVVRITK